jgi:lipopolysaccharide transport system permease protein/teichoic acid transport system permease protein
LRGAINDTLSRRRLIRYLVRAEIKKQGTDTVLGNVWWVLDPLISLLVYVFVMQIVFARDQPDFGLFLLSAMIPFKWFTGTVSDSVNSVIAQGQLIKQIQFPKIVLPTAASVAGIVSFGFGTIALMLLMLLYPHRITPYLLFIPLIAAVQFVFTLGCAYLMAAGNVFFRDLGNVETHILRLVWFLSPGLYSLAALDQLNIFKEHPGLRTLAEANPFAILFTAYRTVIYGTETSLPGPPNFFALFALLVASTILLALATIVFKRLEPNFAKVI